MILWSDGCDRYQNRTQVAPGRYLSMSAIGRFDFLPADGAFGGGCFGCASDNDVVAQLPADQPQGQIVHAAFWMKPRAMGGVRFFKLMDSDSNFYMPMRFNTANGRIKVGGFDVDDLAEESQTSIVMNDWNHVELTAKIVNGATGSVKLWVNGIQTVDFTGNTNPNARVQGIRRFAFNGLVNSWDLATGTLYDDPVVWNETGGDLQAVGPLGKHRITVLPPTANATVEFHPLAGTNVSQIDDVGPDGDATYNYNNNVSGDPIPRTDLFTHSINIGTPASIHALLAFAVARLQITGGFLVPAIKIGAGAVADGAGIAMLASYRYAMGAWSVNPNSGSPFVKANITGGQFGYRHTAGESAGVTQAYAECLISTTLAPTLDLILAAHVNASIVGAHSMTVLPDADLFPTSVANLTVHGVHSFQSVATPVTIPYTCLSVQT